MAEDVDVTVWLAPSAAAFSAARAASLGATPLSERRYASRAELRRHGDADARVRAGLATLARAAGVADVAHAWRRLRLRGTREACARAERAMHASPLERDVVVTFGLEPTVRVRSYACKSVTESAGVRPRAVARAYGMPPRLDGRGSAIGVLHFSGNFHASDLEAAMREAHVETPHCVRRGAGSHSSLEDDVEIALDTQIAGAVAPGAKLVLYRGADDARGYADTIVEALLDEADAPSILSISYGVPEDEWPPDALRLIDQLFVAAALCGITVVAASGDRGAERTRVMFPASDAFVLACGGTTLRLERGRRISEHVWQEAAGASGGGYSRFFARPAWHAPGDAAAGRGVPDVAAHAATATGYRIRVRGTPQVVGGTSAAAPLWAAFVALLNEHLGIACGFFTPLLYALPPRATFYDVTTGSNGRYLARAGWDPCTGLGSPNFGELLQCLAGR